MSILSAFFILLIFILFLCYNLYSDSSDIGGVSMAFSLKSTLKVVPIFHR